MSKHWQRVGLFMLLCCAVAAHLVAQETENANQAEAQDEEVSTVAAERSRDDTAASVLSADEWQRVDEAVECALEWLAARQQDDGSFPSIELGQPGVTSLCVMAFLANGHMPGEGQYGKRLERATDYVLESQKRNGLLSRVGPDGPNINRSVGHEIGEAAAYNHAIASLMLSELYGMSQTDRSARIQEVIAKALSASLEMQRWTKTPEGDRGGWRYVGRPVYGTDSDLSVTGWELMFLRLAQRGVRCAERID